MIRFGTGGWRAVIGDDFIKSNIQKVAQGVCLLAREEGKTDKPIYIGYDGFCPTPRRGGLRRFCAQTVCGFFTWAEARRRRW